MLQLFSLMAVGFFFGMRHATDADHVVAIATIVTRERSLRGAARIGLLWGLGHSVTVAVVGAAIILFGVVIPPRVGLAMEFGVGLMLVVLGVFTLRAVALQAREALSLYLLHGHHGHPSAPTNGHTHLHVHGDYVHAHTHGHAHDTHGHPEHATPQGWLDKRFGRLEAYRALRPVIVGIVHGLAGSAAVALLVLASIRDPLWGLAYLFVFGLGTMVGMMLITVLIAAPFALGASRVPAISAGVRAVAGVLSLAFGLFLMYQIGLVDGLFTGQPTWTPR